MDVDVVVVVVEDCPNKEDADMVAVVRATEMQAVGSHATWQQQHSSSKEDKLAAAVRQVVDVWSTELDVAGRGAFGPGK